MNALSVKALKKPGGLILLGLLSFEGIFVGLYLGEELYFKEIISRGILGL